ncbi:MAG TPA: hypothetical protein VGF21_19025 [Thermoleophilaceae bacterium]
MLLPEPIKRCSDALRRSAREEDGFTIIEVLVSAVLVALSAIGVFTALDSASATSGRDKAKNIASQLAESDQERMRQMRLSQINNLRETRTETSDGDSFTVTSRADWVNDASGTQSCTGSNTSFDYLKIRSTVTWSGMGSAKPVVEDSLRSVPNGSFSATQGSLAIQISDRTGTGLSGVAVSVAGAKNFNETTNSNGCIFIGYIPAGTYTISFGQSGYVESQQPNASNVVDSVVIQGQQTASQQYLYDRAGIAQVNFQTTASVGSGTVQNTTGDAFTVANTGLGIPAYESYTRTTSSGTMTSGATATLFPFSSGYNAYAGGCSQADPTLAANGSQATNPLTVPPGGTSTLVNVRMPRLQARLANVGSSSSTSKIVFKPTTPGCTGLASYSVTNANGNSPAAVSLPLPYGTYTVCGEVTNTNPHKFKQVTNVANIVPNGSAPAAVNSISMSTGTTNGVCP